MNREITQLSSVIDEISMGPFGSDIKVDNFVSSGVPVLNGSNLVKFKINENSFRYVTSEKAKTFKKAIARRGDIIITHRGTLGQISYVPEDSKYEEYVISQSQFRVNLNKKFVNPVYFVYYFHTSEGQKRLLANKCHVGVPALAQATTNFKLIEIPLPHISIQREIAAVLSAIDSKIELNNHINTKLESCAKTIYDYWFSQFDFPDNKCNPYKASGGKMVWSNELNREIPEGWTVEKLNKIATIIMGQSPKGESYNFERKGVPLVNGAADYEGNLLLPKVFTTEPTRMCQKDDMVFCIRATIGKLTFAEDSLCLGRGVAGVRPLDTSLSEQIYFRLLQEIERFKKQATGSIIVGITKDDLTDSFSVIPPDNISKQFHLLLSPLFAKQRLINIENYKLTELREWLLPMLMNGQVKITS